MRDLNPKIQNPLISIVTVCLNSEATIAETIDSVRRQKYENFEHIIFDGGSKDNTLAIVNEKEHPKLHLVRGHDAGIYDAMNQAAELSQGEVLHFLNSDDVYDDENVLQSVVDIFSENNRKILCTAITYFNSSKPDAITRHWSTGHFSVNLVKTGWHPPHPGFFCRREVFESNGGFNCKFNIVADFDFMIRACMSYPKYVSVSDMISVRMRTGGASDQSVISMLKNNLDVCESLLEQGVRISKPVYILRRLFAKLMQITNRLRVL